MVETRDEETGEVTKQLVDKVRRHKITRLKKAILNARRTVKKAKKVVDDSGFETVESGDESEEEQLSIFGDLNIIQNEILEKYGELRESQDVDVVVTKGKYREYVDVELNKELDNLTVKLLLKLKELYFKRKLKQPKGRK